MRYLRAVVAGIITFVLVMALFSILLTDFAWVFNISMISSAVTMVAYLQYKQYNQQQRVQELIDENN